MDERVWFSAAKPPENTPVKAKSEKGAVFTLIYVGGTWYTCDGQMRFTGEVVEWTYADSLT